LDLHLKFEKHVRAILTIFIKQTEKLNRFAKLQSKLKPFTPSSKSIVINISFDLLLNSSYLFLWFILTYIPHSSAFFFGEKGRTRVNTAARFLSQWVFNLLLAVPQLFLFHDTYPKIWFLTRHSKTKIHSMKQIGSTEEKGATVV
jgi:hypothetical protein